jgi:phage gpG-like protein
VDTTKIVAKIKALSSLQGLSDRIGNSLLEKVDQEFEASVDPVGQHWKPVHRKGKPLILTGKLKQSWRIKTSRLRVTLSTKVSYAVYHQYGTSRIHPRRIVPSASVTSWNVVIGAAAKNWARGVL